MSCGWCTTSPASHPPRLNGNKLTEMNHQELLARAFRVIREHPFVLALGVVIAVLSGDLVSSMLTTSILARLPLPIRTGLGSTGHDLINMLQRLYAKAGEYGTAGLIALTGLLLLLLIAVGVLIIVMRGSLIAAVGQIDATGTATLSFALRAGWRKTWRLIIIASIPPIPVTIAAIVFVLIATAMVVQAGGIDAINATAAERQSVFGWLFLTGLCLFVPFSLITYGLGLLSRLAERACVLDDGRVLESFRRGWEVVREHPGDMVLLLLIQVGLNGLLGAVISLPRMISSLYIAVHPIIWLVTGAAITYFMVLWTLAWREWRSPATSASAPH